MDRIVILKLTELKYIDDNTNNIDNLKIGIPLSKIKEIKETGDENICIINGNEIVGTFVELTDIINSSLHQYGRVITGICPK